MSRTGPGFWQKPSTQTEIPQEIEYATPLAACKRGGGEGVRILAIEGRVWSVGNYEGGDMWRKVDCLINVQRTPAIQFADGGGSPFAKRPFSVRFMPPTVQFRRAPQVQRCGPHVKFWGTPILQMSISPTRATAVGETAWGSAT